MGNGGSGKERRSVKIEPPSRKSMMEMKTRAGLKLCYITIVGFISLASLIVIAYFLIIWHSLGSLDGALTEGLLQNYEEIRNAITDDVLKIGEQFLGKLLPIITLLLGYMFGSREEKAEAEEPQEGD